MDARDNLRAALSAGGFPLTKAIIGINLMTMALHTFGVPLDQWLMFFSPESWARPWTLMTYPLMTTHVISLLFNTLWLWMFGGSLERGWGTSFYSRFFAAITLLSGLSIGLGSALLHRPDYAENWLPIAALTVTWCMQNRGEMINIWCVLPVRAETLALVEMGIVFFLYAQNHSHPLMGLFALTGCAAAYVWTRTQSWGSFGLYAATRLAPRRQVDPQARAHEQTRKSLNPLQWVIRHRRKRQFERLMRDD